MNERQPKIAQFIDSTEYLESDPKKAPLRPDDIIVGGESLLNREKTPPQSETTRLAIAFVDEYLKELGVERPSFDSRRITFTKSVQHHGSWNLRLDWVLQSSANEANIHTTIHELVHAYAAEWWYRSEEEIDDNYDKRTTKTGFSTSWTRREGNQSNFALLNEAITEKIARDICSRHSDQITRHPQEYPERFEELIQRAQQEVDAEMQVVVAKYEQENKDIKEKTEREIVELRLKTDAQIREARRVNNDHTYFEWERDFYESLFQMQLSFKQSSAEMLLRMNADFIQSQRELRENLTVETLRELWLKPMGSQAYQDGIEILELILEGLSHSRMQSEALDYQQAYSQTWEDLQHAYFKGSVMWLRKIEKTFGDGILREVALLPSHTFRNIMPGKPIAGVTEKLRKVVTAMKANYT